MALTIDETIRGLNKLTEYNRGLDAKSLHDNPLMVWGAAAGIFSNDEMSQVATYSKNAYGPFAERHDVLKIVGQVDTMANLIAQYLEADVERFVRLCACCGLAFQVSNMEGEIVADGQRML